VLGKRLFESRGLFEKLKGFLGQLMAFGSLIGKGSRGVCFSCRLAVPLR
jgi:hypothetical protein